MQFEELHANGTSKIGGYRDPVIAANEKTMGLGPIDFPEAR